MALLAFGPFVLEVLEQIHDQIPRSGSTSSSSQVSGVWQRGQGVCPNLMTADPAFVDQTIGSLSDATMQQIDACLKAALALP